jgi:hypothetical protein
MFFGVWVPQLSYADKKTGEIIESRFRPRSF